MLFSNSFLLIFQAFEDCLIFNDYMDKYNENFGWLLNHLFIFLSFYSSQTQFIIFFLAEVFEQFTLTRCPDAHAICDLSYYNYIEV